MSNTENKIIKVVGIKSFFKLQDFYSNYSVAVWFLVMLLTPVLLIALFDGVQL